MKQRMTVVALFIALAACANPQRAAGDAASSWAGATYDDVIARWGKPAHAEALADGRKAYTWMSDAAASRSALIPSIGVVASSDGIGLGGNATIGRGRITFVRCERTLVFRDGRVVDQRWQGDGGYCDTFRRA